jgi:transcriptional regulator with XRE-family HTH domain
VSKREEDGNDLVFAKNLKQVLEERGITQRSAAELAGVSTSTLNDWLSGSIPSRLGALLKLCQALKVDFQFMLTGITSNLIDYETTVSQLFSTEAMPELTGHFLIEMKRLKKRDPKS